MGAEGTQQKFANIFFQYFSNNSYRHNGTATIRKKMQVATKDNSLILRKATTCKFLKLLETLYCRITHHNMENSLHSSRVHLKMFQMLKYTYLMLPQQ